MPKRKFPKSFDSTYCRLCLKVSQTELAACGDHLKQAIKRYIGLDIDSGEEGFPEGVCHSCSNKVLVFHEFAELCRQTQHQIKDFLQWKEYSIWRNEYDSEDENCKGFIHQKTDDEIVILQNIIERLQHEYCYEPFYFEYDSDISSDQTISLSDGSLDFDEGRAHEFEELCSTPDSFLELIFNKPVGRRDILKAASRSDDEIQPLSELVEFLINAYSGEPIEEINIFDRRPKSPLHVTLIDLRKKSNFVKICESCKCSHLIDHNYVRTSKCKCEITITKLKQKKSRSTETENSFDKCDRSEPNKYVLTKTQKPHLDNVRMLPSKNNSDKEILSMELKLHNSKQNLVKNSKDALCVINDKLKKSEEKELYQTGETPIIPNSAKGLNLTEQKSDNDRLFLVNEDKLNENRDDLILSLADPQIEGVAMELCAKNFIPYYPAGNDLKQPRNEFTNAENNKKSKILRKENESLKIEKDQPFNYPSSSSDQNPKHTHIVLNQNLIRNKSQHTAQDSDPEVEVKTKFDPPEISKSKLYLEIRRKSLDSLLSRIMSEEGPSNSNDHNDSDSSILEGQPLVTYVEPNSLHLDTRIVAKNHFTSFLSQKNPALHHSFKRKNSIQQIRPSLLEMNVSTIISEETSEVEQLLSLNSSFLLEDNESQNNLIDEMIPVVEKSVLEEQILTHTTHSFHIANETNKVMSATNIKLNATSLNSNMNLDATTAFPGSVIKNSSARIQDNTDLKGILSDKVSDSIRDNTLMLSSLSNSSSTSKPYQNSKISCPFQELKQYNIRKKLLSFNSCDNSTPRFKAKYCTPEDKDSYLSVKKLQIDKNKQTIDENKIYHSIEKEYSLAHQTSFNTEQINLAEHDYSDAFQYCSYNNLINAPRKVILSNEDKIDKYDSRADDEKQYVQLESFIYEEMDTTPASLTNIGNENHFERSLVSVVKMDVSENVGSLLSNVEFDKQAKDELQLFSNANSPELNSSVPHINSRNNENAKDGLQVLSNANSQEFNLSALIPNSQNNKEYIDELQMLSSANCPESNASVLIPNTQNNKEAKEAYENATESNSSVLILNSTADTTLSDEVDEDKNEAAFSSDSMSNISNESFSSVKNQMAVLDAISILEENESDYFNNSEQNKQSNVSEKSNLLQQLGSQSCSAAEGASNINASNESSTLNPSTLHSNGSEIPQSIEMAELLQSSVKSHCNEELKKRSNIAHRLRSMSDKEFKTLRNSDRKTSSVEQKMQFELFSPISRFEEEPNASEKSVLLEHLEVDKQNNSSEQNTPEQGEGENESINSNLPLDLNSGNPSVVDFPESISELKNKKTEPEKSNKLTSTSVNIDCTDLEIKPLKFPETVSRSMEQVEIRNESTPLDQSLVELNYLKTSNIVLSESNTDLQKQELNCQMDSEFLITEFNEKSNVSKKSVLSEHSNSEKNESDCSSIIKNDSPHSETTNVELSDSKSYVPTEELEVRNESTLPNQTLVELNDLSPSDNVFSELNTDLQKPELNFQNESESVITQSNDRSNDSEKSVVSEHLNEEINQFDCRSKNINIPYSEMKDIELSDNKSYAPTEEVEVRNEFTPSNQTLVELNDIKSSHIIFSESNNDLKKPEFKCQIELESFTELDDKSLDSEELVVSEDLDAEKNESDCSSIINKNSPDSESKNIGLSENNPTEEVVKNELTPSNLIFLEVNDINTSDIGLSEVNTELPKPELKCQTEPESVITESDDKSNDSKQLLLSVSLEQNESDFSSLINNNSPYSELKTTEISGDKSYPLKSACGFASTSSKGSSFPLSLATRVEPNNPSCEHLKENCEDRQNISEYAVPNAEKLSPISQILSSSTNSDNSPPVLVSNSFVDFNIEFKNQRESETNSPLEVFKQPNNTKTNSIDDCGNECEQMQFESLDIMYGAEVDKIVGNSENCCNKDEIFSVAHINKPNENIYDINIDTYKQIFDEQYYREVMQFCSNSNTLTTPQKVIVSEEIITCALARSVNHNYVDLCNSRASDDVHFLELDNENLEITNTSNDDESRSFEQDLLSVDRINNPDNVESLLTNIEFQCDFPLNVISKKKQPMKELRIVLSRCKIPKIKKLQRRKQWYFDFVDLNCHICGMECRDWESHELHNSMEHSSQPGVTCVCGRILVSKVQVQVHARKHSKGKLKPNVNDGSITRLKLNIKFFRCGFCVDKCRTWKTLSIHCEKAHRSLPSAKCEHCSQKFCSPINFQLHIMTHEKGDAGNSTSGS